MCVVAGAPVQDAYLVAYTPPGGQVRLAVASWYPRGPTLRLLGAVRMPPPACDRFDSGRRSEEEDQ